MKLVLQCAMCGTLHPVGTAVCSTCRASGVTQLRLMFECPRCGGLGIAPACAQCPPVVPLDLDDELIVAEEVVEEPPTDDLDFDLSFDDTEGDGYEVIDEVEGFDGSDEAIVLDLSEDDEEEPPEPEEESDASDEGD